MGFSDSEESKFLKNLHLHLKVYHSGKDIYVHGIFVQRM